MLLPLIADASFPHPSLDDTFGAFLLGTCFGTMFYGSTLYQTFRYFTSAKHDSGLVLSLVVSLVLLDMLHTACCMHASYYHLVTNYFDLNSLASAVWSLKLLSLLSGLAAILTQTFYARRVFLIGGNWKFKVFFSLSSSEWMHDLQRALLLPWYWYLQHQAWPSSPSILGSCPRFQA
ncbi:hypothetical protein BV20DRAFT_772079 [Pilatotrama ljubarskyi]|nr:hypothetical protein BV20DRAFT_772079 [Pilatotrama ljubarskyi]